MTFKKSQIEMALFLFVKSFCLETDENNRMELIIQFSDVYSGIIKDWESKVEKQIEDEKTRELFRRLLDKRKEKRVLEGVTIVPLEEDYFEQITYLGTKELDQFPWMPEANSSITDFIEGGFSFAAKKDDVVIGFVLAHKCPTYGGYYYIYIDTFVVSSYTQGQGVGRMLFNELRSKAHKQRIYGIRLMTKRNMPAYNIYKHLGFEDMQDEYVQMKCY